MTRRVYLVVLIATVAAFSFALARPDVVLGLYTKLVTPSVEPTEIAQSNSDDQMPDIVIRPVSDDTVSDTDRTESITEVALSDIEFAVDIPEDTSDIAQAPAPTPITPEIAQNRLIVPSMGVDADVIISDSQSALNQGLWHIPGSALPGEDGNIVVSSHRWLYKPPSKKTFYLIDQVKVGDQIVYDYNGKRYNYTVSSIDIVNPEDVHILSQDKNQLTLFTCHPLFSTKQRIVVSAELVSVE